MMMGWDLPRRASLLAACSVTILAQTLFSAPARADSASTDVSPPSLDQFSLGYPLGISLAQFVDMPLPFDDLPKGATVKCGDDPELRQRMVGYVADNEARYESVGVKSCRVVAPDPANRSWWRPVEVEIDGVMSRIRFDFMEVAAEGGDGFDDTGFSDALYGGNDPVGDE
ncbi:MAG: hypothetical protein JNL25_10210, partial [Rhodospirillaceae bacterium]|nr:hypothetical protein [Rhodospirillaceae bacterium]